MSAREALVCLLKTLAVIVDRGELLQTILFNDFFVRKLQSLHDKARLLVDFLGNSPSSPILSELEMKMRKAAYKANNILCRQPDPKFWFWASPLIVIGVAGVHGVDKASSLNTLLLWHLAYPLIAFIVSLYLAREGWAILAIFGVLIDFEMLVRRVNEIRAAAAGDRDRNVVVHFLTRESSQLETVSIVGMGGIGKTTLATQLYNDPYIVGHFDIRLWVTVSQEYSIRSVLLCLLASANRLTKEMQEPVVSEETLALHLHQTLMNRRFLIVMDDVWDNAEIMDYAKARFCPGNRNGSRVLLTSRLLHVAIRSDSLHQMQCLSDDESWKLLAKVAFGEKGKLPKKRVEAIGRKIAQNCGGLPLAIVVVGGLLRKSGTHAKLLKEIAAGRSFQTEDECLNVLGLSYKHLPHHLRLCFLYMGVFPGDCEISVSRLIRLWAAEGFLVPHATKSLEEVGEGYLNDLVDRHLILASKRSSSGKIKTCRMHHLLREVCLINQDFLHIVDLDGSGSPYNIPSSSLTYTPQRLIIHPGAPDCCAIAMHPYFQFIRSLLFTSKLPPIPVYGFRDMLLHLPCLTVLDALKITFSKFPEEITTLVNLQYLALCCWDSATPSFHKLQNLQTLIYQYQPATLRKCITLPDLGLWSMPNLRHLYVKPGVHFMLNPQKTLTHQQIQTLVGLRNIAWSREFAKRIPNLKKLGVSYVDVPEFYLKFLIEFIVDLHQLETLKIDVTTWTVKPMSVPLIRDGLPRRLKKLSISGWEMSSESMAAIAALPNLEVLKLRKNSTYHSSWTTDKGGFTQLKYLLLENLLLADWETDADHFPRLRRLVIRSCIRLQKIPSSIGDIPTLEMIELLCCLPSAADSAREIQREQEYMGNEDLKVHIGPTWTSHL